ncbi:DUF6366 family protein [Halobacillus litoralis]|uniref:DUF6366 family protein n=1 Tax=Halobacillus litoralis TaxID=45668 RepID=UPI001CD73A3E|nr:DUF6366 family protein [Halobacillus litoralis]MCA0970721.1 DUF6366 family protein [Halobacillus litoralis]
MSRDHETPEEKREKLRQKELKNPSSSGHSSNLADLVGGLDWKGTVLLILVLIAGFIVYALFLR